MWLFVPDAARKRWMKAVPRGFDGLLEHTREVMKVASRGGVEAWRLDGADLLAMDGDEPARCEDVKGGVVIIRGDAETPTSKTKWKKKPGTVLDVRAPMSLCSATNFADAVAVKIAKGRYDVSFAPKLLRLLIQ